MSNEATTNEATNQTTKTDEGGTPGAAASTTPTTPPANASTNEEPKAETARPKAKTISFEKAVKMLRGGGVTEGQAKAHVRDAIEHRQGYINFQGITVKVEGKEESSGGVEAPTTGDG